MANTAVQGNCAARAGDAPPGAAAPGAGAADAGRRARRVAGLRGVVRRMTRRARTGSRLTAGRVCGVSRAARDERGLREADAVTVEQIRQPAREEPCRPCAIATHPLAQQRAPVERDQA